MSREENISTVQAGEILREKNIHPSYHRLRILEYLLKHHTHPTVEMIYKDLIKEIPTLSKTTIYNTLKTFAKSGLVMELTIEENEVRFDYDVSHHAHFMCSKCGKIYDVMEKYNLCEDHVVDQHKVEEQHIYFKGICKNCLEKNISISKKN